ncbi:L-ascorbate metabolism protein UlaG, beta-lactamase superfamily [Nakamurella panacisegetis]|uniref:L-ascorbate metabolism protein UlaG, beta-lactamase superfamily n=1 Tax=Nakamurella panacisegetis TaxID=1090615 RepID=A0A1H0KH43_9ACTN|nr:MBL fold metallo-hydrolase [Nakamurella panacisegetis]SDO55215.1 L-ascorbate metabolism protein UlaG, beta-lactamase superfamily [Nakamurella panacisegetis]
MPASRRTRGLSSVITAATLAAAGTGLYRLRRATRGLPAAMGAPPRRIVSQVAGAPQHEDGVFHNVLPSAQLVPGSTPSLIKGMLTRRDKGKPSGPVPLTDAVTASEAGDLAVTWLGHASALIELDGHWILADPVWGDRVSPSTTIGPHRLHAVPMALEDLPELSAVIISHDHYDHLDLPTVNALLFSQSAPFFVPRGIGAHLRKWGVPEDRIVELDWNDEAKAGRIKLTCTEARHFSGRGLKRNVTLWSSWALTGPEHSVYFGGDTGYTPAFAEIGARLGPFDLTILPIGAYGDQWPDIHMNPEEAWRSHGDLGGRVMLPIHWATFDLALHGWSEPIERLLAVADHDAVIAPQPGERVVPADRTPVTRWWAGL